MSKSRKSKATMEPSQKQLIKLARRRLEKYVSIPPRLLVSDRANNIHDIRVWGRRLQQIVRVLYPKPRGGKSRRTIRSLRDVRRDLSACRNLDVTLTLLEEKHDSASAATTRDAWDCVREYTLKLRAKEFARARKQLRRIDTNDFIQKTQRLLRAGKAEDGLGSNFRQSLGQSLAQWHEALDQAKNKRDPECLHSLRLAGKRLRYRWELLAELGDGDAKSRIKSLKALQDKLGIWHDRHVLLQFLEEFIARPNFLRDHPDFYRALESEMKSERRANDAAIGGLLKQAETFRLRQTKPVAVKDDRQKQ